MNASQIKIGWAVRDTTMEGPLQIIGQFHIRISEGIRDPLSVTALVVDDGADSVIFLSADLSGIRGFLLDLIREKVTELNPEIPVGKILMNATHIHTGPNTFDSVYGNYTLTDGDFPLEVDMIPSREYRGFISTMAAEAIAEAWEKRAPGGVAWGYGYATVGHSRRVVYFDDVSKRPGAVQASGLTVNGHGVMYGNTDDDKFSHYEAGADSFVNLMYTFDGAGKLTGAIINVPCPSQNSEHDVLISADYWHDVRAAIRRRYGDIFLLAQCAAAGDLSPRILHYKKAQERRFRLKYGDMRQDLAERKDIAERIAAAFAEVLAWAEKDIRTALPVRHTVETIRLERRLVSDEEYAAELEELKALQDKPFKTDGTPKERMYHNSILSAQRNRHKRIIDRYELQKREPDFPMEMHVVRIGDIAFASNQFELYMDYMHRIQARSPFGQTFIVQLAGTPGDFGGTYLPTERGYADKGYSASIFCNQASPQAGQHLVDETVRILKEIAD